MTALSHLSNLNLHSKFFIQRFVNSQALYVPMSLKAVTWTYYTIFTVQCTTAIVLINCLWWMSLQIHGMVLHSMYNSVLFYPVVSKRRDAIAAEGTVDSWKLLERLPWLHIFCTSVHIIKKEAVSFCSFLCNNF